MRWLDCRVLVVDDDFSIRESLQDALGAEGYAVDVAENGRTPCSRCAGEADPTWSCSI